MADPTHIRLSNNHCHGIVADIEGGSLFSLSGFEVKKFPAEDWQTDAAAWVRQQMRRGVIEAADPSEHEQQQQVAAEVRTLHAKSLEARIGSDNADVQEGSIQELVAKQQRAIIGQRTGAPVEEEAEAVTETGDEKSKVPAGK